MAATARYPVSMLKLAVPILVLMIGLGVTVLVDKPRPPADFTFINRGDINTLDLQRMSWMQDLRVARLLFEGLVSNDVFSHDFDIIPGVAERWEISPDGRTYTFYLREDARWSNGEPVTAHDFIYAWRRALLPDVASDYVAFLTVIEGAQEFYDWRKEQLEEFDPDLVSADDLWEQTRRRFDELVAMKAEGDRVLTVRLVRPIPYFLDICAFAVLYPVYPPVVSRFERPDADTGRLDLKAGWTKPEHIVGNGPFTLETWRFKRDMRFEKNPHYWNRDGIYIDSIAIPSVEDPNAQVLAFDTGAVQWVSDVVPAYRADMLLEKQRFYEENMDEVRRLRALGLDQFEIDRRLPDDPRKNIHAVPAFGTYFYNFNCLPTLPDGRENPFADPQVRRAFALAVDKERIARQIRRLGEPVATTLIPPGSIGGYTSPPGLGYDPVRAREELAAAGYPGGEGFITVEVLFNKDSGHDLIAQAIAKDWQEQLGVNVILQQKEIKVFRNDLKKQNFMVGRAGWYGDYGDPTTFLDINRADDGNNDRKYSNAGYEALLDRAAIETDPVKRMSMLTEAEAIIVERDLPLIPIFHYATIFLFDPDELTGITSHPRQTQNLFLVDVYGDGKGPDEPIVLPPRPARGPGASPREAGESQPSEHGEQARATGAPRHDLPVIGASQCSV